MGCRIAGAGRQKNRKKERAGKGEKQLPRKERRARCTGSLHVGEGEGTRLGGKDPEE